MVPGPRFERGLGRAQGNGQLARLLRPFSALEGEGLAALQSPHEPDPYPQATLRRHHERLVFRVIGAHQVVSRTQLASLTGLSAQSVGRVVQVLIEGGLVEETQMERGKGPVPPRWGCGCHRMGRSPSGLGSNVIVGVVWPWT